MFAQLYRNLPPVTKNLLIINILVWVITALAGSNADATINYYCGLHYFSSGAFNPIQLVTYMFLHGGFTHLFFNMFALFMFGGWIERSLGSKRFLFYYLSCGIGAALIQEGVYALMLQKYYNLLDSETIHFIQTNGANVIKQGMNYSDPILGAFNSLINGVTVGASGSIYGILLAFGMMFPNMPLYLMFVPVPIKAKWMVIGYAALELLLGLRNSVGDNVAHFAHLGGMLLGLIMILYWRQKGTFHNRYY